MRLLHVTKMRSEEFFEGSIPSYAILSQRWGSDEVSFQDFLAGCKRGGAGYAKTVACCKQVASDVMSNQFGYSRYGRVHVKWVWIDTCCINNSSSAELSEAVNSMCRCYERANVCYVYLSHVLKRKIIWRKRKECFKRPSG